MIQFLWEHRKIDLVTLNLHWELGGGGIRELGERQGVASGCQGKTLKLLIVETFG